MIAVPAAVNALGKYPERPIRLVIPFAPGGNTDIMGRRFAFKITPLLGQQVVIDNRAGAGGNIGAAEVARARADGYTLLTGTSSTHAINPLMMENMSYDPVKDFAPIAVLGISYMVIAVHPTVLERLRKEDEKLFIELEKKFFGKLSFRSEPDFHAEQYKIINVLTNEELATGGSTAD